jgi:hypothetical protein
MRLFFEPPGLFDEVGRKALTCHFEDEPWEKALSSTLHRVLSAGVYDWVRARVVEFREG